MKNNGILVIVVVVIMAALGAAGYYYAMTQNFFQPTVWDGVYKMTGNLTCQGTFPGLTAIPMDSNIYVSSNKIIDETTDKRFDIDQSGKAAETMQQVQEGTSADVKADFQFYEEDGIKKLSANGVVKMTTDKANGNYSSTCSGTVIGVKQ